MRKMKEVFIVFTCFMMWFVFLCGWTYTYDIATPLGSDAPSVLDDRDRETKAANQERQNVDHYWPLTGTEVSDADAGKHRQVTFRASISTPSQVTDEAHLYMQADDLWYQNDTDTTIQITNGGEIEYQSISDVNSNTYIVSVDNAGTGTADLIKADANDLATLPDGALLAAATESGDGDRTITDKGYVDTDTSGFTAYTNESTAFSNKITHPGGMIELIGYAYERAAAGILAIDISGAGFTNVFHVDITNVFNSNALNYDVQVKTISTSALVIYHGSNWATYGGVFYRILGN